MLKMCSDISDTEGRHTTTVGMDDVTRASRIYRLQRNEWRFTGTTGMTSDKHKMKKLHVI